MLNKNKKSKCKGLVSTSVLVAFFIGQVVSLSLISNYQHTYSADKLYQDKISAIVRVYALTNPEPTAVGSGTGFFISKDGLVITAAHVVYDDNGHPNGHADLEDNTCNFIFIKTAESRFYTVKLVRLDLEHDIALLKVSKTLKLRNTKGPIKNVKFIEGKEVKKDFPTLEIVKVDRPIPGEVVMAIGFPGRFGPFIAMGIVSSPRPQATADEEENVTFKDLVATSMLIFPGNSGGPVFNKYGKVVGIATLGSRQTISFYQRSKYIKRLITSTSKDLIIYKREPYNKEYDE